MFHWQVLEGDWRDNIRMNYASAKCDREKKKIDCTFNRGAHGMCVLYCDMLDIYEVR